jgi:RimJ/RimL family protein N-acetyltransferase
VLLIRPVGPSDVAGLLNLYSSLPADDVYLRFFSSHPPPERFITRMASVAERGGCGLVAVVEMPGSDPRLVGEASYELLPNGDGELGITISRDYRGWLGPYLLDTLLTVAAAAGVPNVEAEVLVANRRMLSLLRTRGLVFLDHDDSPATVHVAISTTAATPSWPGPHDRPRVLVEARGGRWHAEQAARRAGLQVLVCQGPSRSSKGCPVSLGGECPLASGADLIIDALAGSEGSSLLEAHRASHPSVPLCVELPAEVDDPAPGVEVIARSEGDRVVIGILERITGVGEVAP